VIGERDIEVEGLVPLDEGLLSVTVLDLLFYFSAQVIKNYGKTLGNTLIILNFNIFVEKFY